MKKCQASKKYPKKNTHKRKEVTEPYLSIMVNHETFPKLMNNQVNDVIQRTLEYNAYLISKTIEKKETMREIEFNSAMRRLCHNLNNLYAYLYKSK